MQNITQVFLALFLTGPLLENIVRMVVIQIITLLMLTPCLHLMAQLLMERHGNGVLKVAFMFHSIVTFLKPLET